MRRFAAVLLLASAAARADYMDHFAVREDVGPRKAPSLGEARLLVMPVEVAGHPPLDLERIRRFFSPDDPAGFVRYYETASLGRYRPVVTVGPKIVYPSCPLPAASFPDCSVARGDIAAFSAGMDMIRDVVRRTNEAGFDFSAVDVNGRRGVADGWADGVMLLTNVPFGGIAFPFAFFNRGDNLAGGAGGPLIVDGVKIPHVAIAGESDVFVMVHEFGHLLGLTDLYDETQAYDGLYLSFMGAWSYDAFIVLPDAETRFRLRWAQWHQVQGRQRVRIRPAETSGEVYRLGTGDEYFLLENRGPGAFDRSVQTRGLAVFHVDRSVRLGGKEGDFVQRLLNCVECDPWHPYIALVQADGRFDIERNGRFLPHHDLFRDFGSLGPDASGLPRSPGHQVQSTNAYSGAPTGLSLDDVQVLADGTIEVTLEAPAAGQCEERLCAEGDGCAPLDCGVSNARGVGCAAAPGAPVAWLLALAIALWRRARPSRAASPLLAEQRVGRRQRRLA